MNLQIIFESFKFYKLKSDKIVKVWFLLLIFMRSFITMAPIGDREFKFLDYYLSGQFFETLEVVMPSKGNILIIGLYLIGLIITICIGLLYAEVLILENESKRTSKTNLDSNHIFIFPLKQFAFKNIEQEVDLIKQIKTHFTPSAFKRNVTAENKKSSYAATAFKDLLKFLPGLLLFLILLFVVLIFSSALLLIPFFVVLCILVFTPLNSMYSQNKLIRSMELSHAQTKGVKINIFFNFIMLNFFFNLIMNLLLLFLIDYHYSFLMLEALVFAVKALAFARLYAMLYQILALKQPYQIKT